MEKQTAVEWFAEQDNLALVDYLQGKINEIELAIKKATILEKAKQLEKEQINDKTNTKPNYDFISGYKAAEKELPTWDDIRRAIGLSRDLCREQHIDGYDEYTYSGEEIIEQLKLSKTN